VLYCIVCCVCLCSEIQHLFYSKENDWGFSNFIAMTVCNGPLVIVGVDLLVSLASCSSAANVYQIVATVVEIIVIN